MVTKLIGEPVLEDDPQAARIRKLEAESRELHRQLDDAQVEARRAREDANRAMGMLRTQLGPLYRALQAVFGELDAAGVEERQGFTTSTGDNGSMASAPSKNSAVWAAWKERFPPAVGKVIDALLLHGEMNQGQLKIACRIGSSTVTDCVSKLNKAGLINKNGGRVSLKAL